MKHILLSVGLLLCGIDVFASIPTPGTLDTTFNVAGANPGYMNLHTELSVTMANNFITPTVAKVLLQNSDGSYFIAANDPNDNGCYITKMTQDDIQDTVFASATDNVLTVTMSEAIAAMMIDQAGYLVVVGTFGFIAQYDATTGVATSWNATMNLDKGWGIAQQSNGRYIVAGKKNGSGALLAYNSVTGDVDTTFGVNGLYIQPGFTMPINAVLVDTQDNIYFAYTNFGQYMVLVKLSSDGTTLIWTQTTFYQTNPVYNHLAFDTDNNIIILGLRIDGPVGMIQYDPSGNLITNTSFGSFSSITSMVVDENNRLIFAGYNGTSPFIVRTNDTLNDLDLSFGTDGFVTLTVPDSSAATWNAIMINNSGKITVAGSGVLSSINTPYLMRVYGNESVGQYNPSVTAGVPGYIDTNFGTDSYVDISALLSAVDPSLYVEAVPTAIVPMPDGSRYIACTVPQSFSFIIRLTNGNILDTTYGDAGISSVTNFGVSDMIMDGSGRLLLLGSYPDNGASWVMRYVAGNSGDQDLTFNNGNGIFLTDVKFTQIIQQTLSRYVIVGADVDSGDATLWAFTDEGLADTTFNSQMTPGYYSTSSSHLAATIVADVYDRLIFAHYVAGLDGGNNVALTRLTASGELDLTFGDDAGSSYSGSIADAIPGASDAMQIRVVFDARGNIVVAAKTDPNISIASYENTTGENLVYSLVIDDTTITENATISDCIATADGNVLLSASLSDEGNMWIARVTSSGLLDTTFNPSGSTYGTIRGVMQFTFRSDTPDHFVTAIAMYGDGTISIVGYEVGDGPTVYDFLATAYDTPYTTQELLCQNSKPIGTNDLTFGIQAPPVNGFFFVATPDTERYDNQYAQAIALQDDQTIIVAVDGQVSLDGQSQIFLNVFDVDGLLDENFNDEATPGQAVVLTEFDNQYVRDMMTFITSEGVHKAILAGYVTNTALSCNNSLVMQYDLDAAMLDATFGGYNGDVLGLAVGTGFSQGCTIGRQSMGRIILGGFNAGNGVGFLQGYTPAGQLDQSFGAGGYCNQGETGIYASFIDSQDRVVIAYNDGSDNLILARILSDGSGLDLTFGGEGTGTFFLDYGGTLTSNNSFRIAVDASGTMYIASILADGTEIAVYAFNPDTLDTKSSGFDASDFGGSLTGYTIGKLLINNEGNLVIIGADTTSILVAQITTNGGGFLILDPHFNAADTPGYLRYTINGTRTISRQIISDALIHPDGRCISVGSNLPPT